jgi:hypothetical protein
VTNTQQPDLMAHTKDRMAEVAAASAQNMAMRKFQSVAKSYLPKMLWPLIPGVRGSVTENAKAGASKWLWGAVSSAVISLLFLAFFAMAFLGVGLVIVYAVVMG